MKRRYAIIVKGNQHTWSFSVWAEPEHVDDWREDGLEVDEIINTVPLWVPAPLRKWWILAQDIFNFRWGDLG